MKYGVILKINEEVIDCIFSKHVKGDHSKLLYLLTKIALANLELENFESQIESALQYDVRNDVYLLRLKSNINISKFYSVSNGEEYPITTLC